jgi:translocation and assembly module TamB
LAGAELAGPKAKLALGAGGNLKQGARLSAAGKISAGVLAPLVPGVRELFGDMDVKLELGLGERLQLRGQAQLSDGYVQLDTGTFIRKVNGKLVLDGQRVRVEALSAAFGGGVLSASGTLDLRGARIVGYDLELGADRVAFEPQERFEVALDATGGLTWAQGGAAPKLKARVRVHKLVYARHVQLPDALISLNRGERAAAYDPARDRLTLDIEVEHEQPLVIRNNFLDAEVAVVGPGRKLRVVGSDQRLGLLGKLEVLRGRVLFRGDEFKVTRGDIAFDDAERLDPSFDLRGVAEKRKRPDATILFSARGSRDTFDLKVSCEASGPEPPPFTCDFTDNRFRCDSFDALVRLWVCRPGAELSSAP